jgi:hypothetical protein
MYEEEAEQKQEVVKARDQVNQLQLQEIEVVTTQVWGRPQTK